MTKRELSPAPLPPSKRRYGTINQRIPIQALSFENSLYDELILCILSYLSCVDLCAVQATSRNLARLGADNELWRKLYYRVYGRTRLRGARGFIGRPDGREVKPLPERAGTEDHRDWKWMFRISSNWRTGRCSVEQLKSPSQSSIGSDDERHRVHILLAGSMRIIASSELCEQPRIIISRATPSETQALSCESRQGSTSRITALAIDQSPPSSGKIRLASFLSTGEFAVFVIHHTYSSPPSREFTYIPAARTVRNSPIVQAVYHHPLLITLSQTFTLSIYELSLDTVRLVQTLSTFTSFPPTSLVLSTPSPTTYRLLIAYTVPVYPAHWSVGATELLISGHSVSASSPTSPTPSLSNFSQHLLTPSVDSLTVTATRTIRALNVPPGWIDENKLRVMREQWNRKLAKVADTQTDGKWLVIAPGEPTPSPTRSSSYSPPSPSSPSSSSSSSSSPSPTSDMYSSSSGVFSSSLHSPVGLQLYRIAFPTATTSVSSPAPKLTFVRTLHGQTGPVSALALADGRCVSLGLNGSIWVWDLEAGTGTEVATANRSPGLSLVKGTVCFDDRRIITAQPGGVVVRRFDV